MVAKTTLQRYIKRLDDVILSGDSSTAEEIQDEILAALGSDIDGLKRGLENYAPFVMCSTSDGRKSPGTVLLDSFCEWKKSTRTVPGDF